LAENVNHDPYTPPRSQVGDVPDPSGKPPNSVNIAVGLIAVMLVIALREVILDVPRVLDGEMSFLAGVWDVVGLLVFFGLGWMLLRGKNRARYLLLVFSLGGLVIESFTIGNLSPNLPEGVTYIPDYRYLMLELIPHILRLIVLYLVFIPGREWFQARSA
jgi:hypothetical protein